MHQSIELVCRAERAAAAGTVGTPLLVTLPRLRPPAILCYTILCILPAQSIADGQSLTYRISSINSVSQHQLLFLYLLLTQSTILYNCSQFSVCLYASILRSFDFWAVPMNNRPKYTRDRQCLCICMPIDYSNSGEMVQHKKREIRKLRCIHEKYWLD